MLRLAGMRIDPSTNGRYQTSFNRGIQVKRVGDGAKGKPLFEVKVGSDEGISSISWSHRSNAFAYQVVSDQGTALRVVTIEGDKFQERSLLPNLSTVTTGITWMPDGQSILCTTVPDNRGDEPTGSNVPTGPNIQESIGNTSPTRTYQDLLSNAHDKALFEYYATAQLVLANVDGLVRKIGEPQIYSRLDPSPDGKYVLRTVVKKPYSYLMTYRSFPQTIDIIDLAGNVQHTVANVPLAENIPIGGVRTGPRSPTWKAGTLATLLWVEALDDGDPEKKVEYRDRVMQAAAPFDGQPAEMIRTQHRMSGFTFLPDEQRYIATEYDRKRNWVTAKIYSPDNKSGKVFIDRNIRDQYGDPGRMVTQRDSQGQSVARMDGDWVYLTGRGASPQGMLPFIDRLNLSTLKTERLWRCKPGQYESVVEVLRSSDDKKPFVITVAESPTKPANYSIRDLESGEKVFLTEFEDPTPQIRGIKKKLVKYQRSDGVPLSATLYLPADYKEGTRLPLVVWAYPREFSDAKTAGQVAASPSRLTRMRGITHLTLLTQGYAIMDGATMPVIGDPETMNDTFIEQIVDAAQAAIDHAVELGVADRNRVGVGGHSYGAFMTANLLAHCDLFNAGIARSGAYNRTLTPFGFQSERRTLWNAKSVYFGISPFLHANKINEPMLMIHGEKDNNSGTFPIQSKRMYQAIKGNGGTVRLVMLPNESHGYRARESVLHTQAEMIAWFDKYVKNAQSPTPDTSN